MSFPHNSHNSPTLDAVIQKLEFSLLSADEAHVEEEHNAADLHADTSTSTPTPTAPCFAIRQIVTRNLMEPQREGTSEGGRIWRDLQSEVEERTLSPTYQDPVQLEQMLDMQSFRNPDRYSTSWGRQQMRAYQARLQSYQEGQQRQAQLVQKLQNKVLQYKMRCGDLEDQVLEKTAETEKLRLSLQSHLDSTHRLQRAEQDLQTKGEQLEETHKRCASLSLVNSLLREQLEQATTANEDLASTNQDLASTNQDLVQSLEKARQDAELSASRLRQEQEMCASQQGKEQARVRALWRQAASLRTTFTQLRASTDRELADMRGDWSTASHQLQLSCMSLEARARQDSASSGVELTGLQTQLREKLSEAMQLQGRWDAEKVELNSRIVELTDTVKQLRSESREKDHSVASMQLSLDHMESRRSEEGGEMEGLRTEIHELQQTLLRVQQMVGCDGDGSETSSSPQRTSTLITLQRTLSRHQTHTQELQGRLDEALEQVGVLRGQLQEEQADRRRQEQESLDESQREGSHFHSSLELLTREKASVEKLLLSVQQEVEDLRSSSLELERQRDLLERQLAYQHTETQRGERSVEQFEVKLSELRREVVSLKEVLSQVTLEKEVLEEEKTSLSLALNKAEVVLAEQEVSLALLHKQEAALRDTMAKMEALSEGLASDKVELTRLLLQVEGEKAELCERRWEAESERSVTRGQGLRLQEQLAYLGAEKGLLQETRGLLEEEVGLLQKEKDQLQDQLTQVRRRLQEAVEELGASSKEVESQASALRRACEEREVLVQSSASLVVQLNSAERKTWTLTQDLASVRKENESVEAALFESQELTISLEVEQGRMEEEKRGLLQAKDALTREVGQLQEEVQRQALQAAKAGTERGVLEDRLVQAESSHQLTLSSREQVHREELSAQRADTERQHAALQAQREQAEEKVEQEVRRMQQEVRRSVQEAEARYQQVLLQKEAEKADKAVLAERLQGLQQDLVSAGVDLQRTRREAHSQHEHDKDAMATLFSELQQLQTSFHEAQSIQEDQKLSLAEQITDLTQQRDHNHQEVQVCRMQLQLAEEQRNAAHSQVLGVQHQLQEALQDRDQQRQEALDLRRLLGDETREREALRASNQELRTAVKRAESDNNTLRRASEEKEQTVCVLEEGRRSMQEECSTLHSTLRQLEKSQMQGRRDVQELRRQVKVLERETRQQKEELRAVHARLSQEEQREEEARREAFILKQRVLECEAGREAALKQSSGFQRCVGELQAAERQAREALQEKEAALRDAEQRLQEAGQRLERAAEARAQEISLGLSLAQGRTQGLQDQLCLAEATQWDTEQKLRALWSAVRRGLGLGLGWGVRAGPSNSPGARGRSPLPRRTSIGQRGEAVQDSPGSPSRCAEEVDVESVQSGLRALYQELRETQRDRDEARSQTTSLGDRVKELQISQEKSAAHLLQLQAALKDCTEGKRDVSEQLLRGQCSLSRQEEAWRQALQENSSLSEELVTLRAGLQRAEADSRTLQERLRALEAEGEAKTQRLREALQAAEARASRLELAQRGADDACHQAQGRAAALAAALVEREEQLEASEERRAALWSGEERLGAALVRAGQQEEALREELRRASGSLSSNRRSTGALQEEIAQLQAALAGTREDRRRLQEQLDKLRDALSESKRLNHTLTGRAYDLQTGLDQQRRSATELQEQSRALKEALKQQKEAGLEAQGSAQQYQQERLRALQVAVTTLQTERGELERRVARLEKDKNMLLKALEKMELQSLRKEEEEEVLGAQEKEQLLKMVRSLERDLAETHTELQSLQARYSELGHAQAQRLLEETARHAHEMDLETGRLHAAQLQAQQTLESREKAHRQRVKGLEGQVLTLEEQLQEEMRKRQARAHRGLAHKPSPKH